jgi:hypothetical protein
MKISKEQWEEIEQKIAISLQQIENDKYVVVDDNFWEELKQRVLKRLENNKNKIKKLQEIQIKLSDKDFMNKQVFELIDEEPVENGDMVRVTFEVSEGLIDIFNKIGQIKNLTKEEVLFHIIESFVKECGVKLSV